MEQAAGQCQRDLAKTRLGYQEKEAGLLRKGHAWRAETVAPLCPKVWRIGEGVLGRGTIGTKACRVVTWD